MSDTRREDCFFFFQVVGCSGNGWIQRQVSAWGWEQRGVHCSQWMNNKRLLHLLEAESGDSVSVEGESILRILSGYSVIGRQVGE